ncbi:MAG: PEP-CTERM sorting domain-containing protein [Symploca sp. SIO2C1]|nr:PEP-CTERM sorting domain-containing protein [Symploca sp. SIO2C1]
MASFTVTNLLDFGTGSLRQAILDANGLGGADEILFYPGLSGGTINLTSGELLITDDLSINGLGADFLGVDAGGFSKVFNVDDGDDGNFLDVLLNGLTITGGSAEFFGEGGGGISNAENLTLSNSIISGNSSFYDAGGISNSGELTVTNSSISDNQAFFYGTGGISNSGELTITNSSINQNFGLTIGGIKNSGELTMTNSTISGNSSRGTAGIYNLGEVSVTNSTISGNDAIYGDTVANRGELTVTNSTISSNTSFFGTTVTNSGELTLTNSTISGNSSYFSSSVTNYSGVSATVSNTIIAGNIGNTSADVFGDFTSNGFNLIGDITGSTGFDNDLTFASLGGISIQDVIDTNLADNGGLTLTHALIGGSPAIDAGNNDDISALTDQRGAGFDRIVDGNNDTIAIVDIGAFEVQQQSTSVPEPSSMLGLFGLVIVASGSILKRKLQQKL